MRMSLSVSLGLSDRDKPVAFAYNEQLVSSVPVEPSDMKVDAILMEHELICCNERAKHELCVAL